MIFHDFFVKQAKLAQFKPGLQDPLKLDNIFTDNRLRQFWSTLNHVAELRKTEPAPYKILSDLAGAPVKFVGNASPRWGKPTLRLQ